LRDAALTDAEELSDLYVHRPIAARVVGVLLRTPITPNQVTVLSGALGVGAAAALAVSVEWPGLRIASAALLLASTVLDCCDGQLARAKKMMSANGMALDAAADAVVGLTMVLGATRLLVAAGGSPRLWLLAIAALASYLVQCFLFDVVKEQFFAAHGLRYASSKAALADHRDARQTGVRAAFFDLYWRASGPIVGRTGARRRRAIAPREMRLWTFVGQGTHMTCLYVAAAVSALWMPALLACLIVFAVAMNVWVFALIANGASPLRS
jgi:phosphatidylglycerophosphate synthase